MRALRNSRGSFTARMSSAWRSGSPSVPSGRSSSRLIPTAPVEGSMTAQAKPWHNLGQPASRIG